MHPRAPRHDKQDSRLSRPARDEGLSQPQVSTAGLATTKLKLPKLQNFITPQTVCFRLSFSHIGFYCNLCRASEVKEIP